IGRALEYFTNAIKKRRVCFLLSDFLAKGYEAPLRIAARRHDLIGVQIVDPRETALPNIGLMRVKDPETGQVQWLDTASASVRRHYENWHREQSDYFRGIFLKSGADALRIQTDEPYVNALLKFFHKRIKA
ncbi:MAG: DUF58 domain-containing protein, partial [Saprospiraceae bacterium]|nr:DUF58 domain-containing protein [Saprospiraceae bacterium]